MNENKAKINGKFAMNTSLEFDLTKGKYVDKITSFEIILDEGEAASTVAMAKLNLSKYTETTNSVEKLLLEPVLNEDNENFALSEGATIEVRVTTKDIQE